MNYIKPWFAAPVLLCFVTASCASGGSSAPYTPSKSAPIISTPVTTEKAPVTLPAPVQTRTLTAGTATGIAPGSVFDFSYWNITVPTDLDKDSKPDTIKIPQISKVEHPDFFYLNADRNVVFTSPNKALTTKNSSNTRSELRHMSRGSDKSIDTKEFANNFSILAHKKSDKFAAVGGKLEATLSVNHVSINAGHPEKYPAYSAVVGQIHGVKEKKPSKNGGWGNEPIKIYYKKWPNHKTGSVFWTYERNLAKKDKDRTDIAFPVWGHTWENPADPGDKGISLNEEFSYTINVHENVMHLTFENARQGVVKQSIDLSNNKDIYGVADEKDNPFGYTEDQLYFKAGIYNQCSTSDKEGFWYAACPGTGVWSEDKANGNYAQSTFSKIKLSPSEAP